MYNYWVIELVCKFLSFFLLHVVVTIFLFILVQEVQEEGKNAIDSPGSPMAPTLPPEEYALGNQQLFKYFLFVASS